MSRPLRGSVPAPGRRRSALRRRRGPLFLALAACLGACGYRAGLTLPEGWEAVGVEVFANDSRERLVRNLERDLQAEMAAAVRRLARVRLVAPEEADLVIRGRITDLRRRRGIRSPENELLETGVRIEVESELVERVAADGEPRVLGEARYATESGYRLEDPRLELDAQERVLRNIADRLVLDLLGPVAYVSPR